MGSRTFRIIVRGSFDGLTPDRRAEDPSPAPPGERQRLEQAARAGGRS
ncbi:DUF6204 family protein [Streptomyces sp. NPDC059989]